MNICLKIRKGDCIFAVPFRAGQGIHVWRSFAFCLGSTGLHIPEGSGDNRRPHAVQRGGLYRVLGDKTRLWTCAAPKSRFPSSYRRRPVGFGNVAPCSGYTTRRRMAGRISVCRATKRRSIFGSLRRRSTSFPADRWVRQATRHIDAVAIRSLLHICPDLLPGSIPNLPRRTFPDFLLGKPPVFPYPETVPQPQG